MVSPRLLMHIRRAHMTSHTNVTAGSAVREEKHADDAGTTPGTDEDRIVALAISTTNSMLGAWSGDTHDKFLLCLVVELASEVIGRVRSQQ